VDIAALAPKAQSTVFPWREPKRLAREDDRPGACLSAIARAPL